MRKVAIFVEGQTEMIFVRKLIFQIFTLDILKIDCRKLLAGNLNHAPYDYSSSDPKIYFQIINVGNDNLVLGEIISREKKLIESGFEKIIGLRDMYSEDYKKSVNVLDKVAIKKFIESHDATIKKANNPSKIKFYFAIMETEAWFLAFCSVFERINKKLTIKYIDEKLKINLGKIDPQNEFLQPSKILDKIFNLCGLKYDKSISITEKIVSKITEDDYDNVIRNKRVSSFISFYNELKA